MSGPAATLPPVTVLYKRDQPSDDVSILVGDRRISGWTDVRITRGIERVPGDFELTYTENPALRGLAMGITPGQPCTVMIGEDTVITGYIDRVMPSIDARRHRITAIGRGRCQDLVDCSANYKGGQFSSSKVDDIATVLAFPYEIGVETDGDMGQPIPAFNISHGETPFEIIERICRFRQLVPYELANGNLMLTRSFTRKAGSGFREGVNVQRASAVWSMDQRYSDYWVYQMALDMLQELGDGGNLIGKCNDPGVPRFRLRKVVSEAPASFVGKCSHKTEQRGKAPAAWPAPPRCASRATAGAMSAATCSSRACWSTSTSRAST